MRNLVLWGKSFLVAVCALLFLLVLSTFLAWIIASNLTIPFAFIFALVVITVGMRFSVFDK